MSLIYLLREGIAGFRRARLAAAGSILTIMLALMLLGAFRLISINTGRLLSGIRNRIEMEAFCTEPIPRQRLDDLHARIATIEGVDSVAVISKDDAARIFRQEFGKDINTVLDFNPFPPSLRVYLKEEYRTSDRALAVQQQIRTMPGIDTVIYRKEMLSFIERQSRFFDRVGLILGTILAVTSIFVTSNTIRLTIAARRRSIQTMKLVGATRWFVRAPFLFEGILQGLAGGCAAAGLFAVLLGSIGSELQGDLAAMIQADEMFYVSVVVLGAVLGLFGSAISVWRFISETV